MAKKVLLIKTKGEEQQETALYEEIPFNEMIPETHVHLFRFLAMDIEEICQKIYALSDGFFQNPGEKTHRNQKKILGEIKSLHPYMALEKNAERLFNDTVIQYIGNKYNNHRFLFQAMTDLCVSPFPDKESIEQLMKGNSGAAALPDLIHLQKELSYYLMMLLDDTSEDMARMPRADREVLMMIGRRFTEIGNMRLLPISVTTTFSESLSGPAEVLNAQVSFDSSFREQYSSWIKGMMSQDNKGNKTPVIPDIMGQEDNNAICITYKADNFADLLKIELAGLLYDNTRIKRCKNCGRYFVYSRENSEFCLIPPIGSDDIRNTCAGAQRKKDVKTIYNRAYKTHHRRVMRGSMDKDSLDKWRNDTAVLKESAEKFEISLDTFRELINI